MKLGDALYLAISKKTTVTKSKLRSVREANLTYTRKKALMTKPITISILADVVVNDDYERDARSFSFVLPAGNFDKVLDEYLKVEDFKAGKEFEKLVAKWYLDMNAKFTLKNVEHLDLDV